MKAFLVRGVPASVQMDGWWINKEKGGGRARNRQRTDAAGAGRLQIWALIGLIALADQMIWQVDPGLSLAVFGIAILAVGYVLAGQKGAGGIGAAAVLFLPLVEQMQALSVLFWLAGMALGAGWIALAKWPGLGRLMTAGARFVLSAPRQVLGDARELVQVRFFGVDLRAIVVGWALPLGVGAVFVMLLLDANPMIENGLNAVLKLQWLSLVVVDRMVFWLAIGALIWPFLALRKMRERLKLPFFSERRPEAENRPVAGRFGFVNAGSVRRSLLLFNVVFALQIGMDAAYLWGGAALPAGMGYAEYAHRGAYPLLVMALMAGGFALLSRPFVAQNRMLKAVLLVWIMQTVLLVVSSLYRLDLYIEVFGLTRLRLAALVWMGVVAAGLVLVIWQVLRGFTTAWLLSRVAILGAAVLYFVCFISFDRTIARYNLTHDVPQDVYYLCSLGAGALPEIRQYEAQSGQRFCHSDEPRAPDVGDWREWGFRDWRVQRNLAKISNTGARL